MPLSHLTCTFFHFGNEAVIIHVNSHLEITVRTEFLVLDKWVGKCQEEVYFSFLKLSVLHHLIQAVVRQMSGVFPVKNHFNSRRDFKIKLPLLCVMQNSTVWAKRTFSLEMEFQILIDRKKNLPSFTGYVGSNGPGFLIVQVEVVHCQIAGGSTLRSWLDHSLSYLYLHFEFTKKEPNPALKWHQNEAGGDMICSCCYLISCVWIVSWSLNILLHDAGLGHNCKILIFLL